MVRAMFKEYDCIVEMDDISFNGNCIVDIEGSEVQIMLELKTLLIDLFQHNTELVIDAIEAFTEVSKNEKHS